MTADTLSLVGKVAIVTGSGRENGIGAAIARALARNGASVAIHHVSENSKDRAEKVAADISREFGSKTVVVQGAIEEQAMAEKIVRQTLKAFNASGIDILVNNAGIGLINPLMESTPQQLNHDFGVNVFGSIYLTQAVVGVGAMPRGGRIINIGTISSKQGPQGTPVYAAAKAAQDSLTASWAGELGPSRGITVNTIAPGPVPTDLSRVFLETPEGNPSPMLDTFYSMARAEARLGTPEDIADAVLLLTSEKSRWITAQWISVSGGITGTM
ncbi:hypothetical protein JX266_009056 [Neoarthrinium moseri]|nr:hypothetical protein JX266_009056 [Neoarthrinium moseri]